jgi:hypothetical protein
LCSTGSEQSSAPGYSWMRQRPSDGIKISLRAWQYKIIGFLRSEAGKFQNHLNFCSSRPPIHTGTQQDRNILNQVEDES